MENITILENGGITAAGDAAKKIKVKPVDFNSIIHKTIVTAAKVETPVTPIMPTAIKAKPKKSAEPIKYASQMIMDAAKQKAERPPKPRKKVAKKESISTIDDSAIAKNYSIVNNDPERTKRKVAYILENARKIGFSPETDYDKTMVNAADVLASINNSEDAKADEIKAEKERLAATKSETTAKNSDIATASHIIEALINPTNNKPILGRGHWVGNEIEDINRIISEIIEAYMNLTSILEGMKATVAGEQEDAAAIDRLITNKNDELEQIRKKKVEAIRDIEAALKIAADSDKEQTAAKEIARKAKEEIEKRDKKTKEMREKNPFLRANTVSETKAELEAYKKLKENLLLSGNISPIIEETRPSGNIFDQYREDTTSRRAA